MHAFDPPLGTIEEEAALCRKACADLKVGDYVWHCHHETLFEALTEPVKYRIAYILAEKPTRERAARLRLLRPGPPELAALYADYRAKRDALAADYEAKFDALDTDYEAKRDALYADYRAKRDALYAEAKCDACYADEQAKRALLYAEAKRDALYADYQAKFDALYADYEAKRDALHAASCPNCPWDGETIADAWS